METTPQNNPPSVQEGMFTRIGRTFDSFIGSRFRLKRNQVAIGPDGSKVDNADLLEKANLLGEKIYHAYVLGRLNFLQQTDGVSDESIAMRKEYWKWAVTEPALESAIWTKLIKVISNQLVMQPASKSPYDKAVAEWVKDCIIRSAGGMRKIGEQIFYHGLVWGNVLCEPIWKLTESPQWKSMFPHGYYTLKDIWARDPADYRLEIDGHRNVIGVWTQKTNEWFPPSYFIRWANRPIYANPAGTSAVRSSRRACMLLKAAQTFRGIYLEQFGLPMMKGKYNRNDNAGYEIAVKAIQRARAMGFILLPDGVELEAMQIATRGETEYQEAIDDYRKEIFLAQTGSYLYAMEGSVSDGAGNSETHKSTLDLVVWYLCSIFEEILNDQVIPWIVQLNCYNAALPRASIGGVDDNDLKASLEIDTGLFNLGLKLDEDELYERYHRSPPSTPDKAVRKSNGQPLPMLGGGLEVPQVANDPFAPSLGGNGAPQQSQDNTANVYQIIALQKAFTAGELQRDAAIQTAVAIGGVPREVAEKLFPLKQPVQLLPKQVGTPPVDGTQSKPSASPKKEQGDTSKQFSAHNIPLIQQSTNYTCGPVALQYALQHFGMGNGLSEALIAQEAGSTSSGGTTPGDLVRVARQYGLEVESARSMSLGEMRDLTDAGKLVIASIQSGGSQQSNDSNQNGHYVVVKKVDNDAGLVGYFDPSTSHDTEWVPFNHFVSNWHDREENGKLYSRFGIALSARNASQFDAGPHKCACIMAMPDESIVEMAEYIQSQIEPDDLADKGIEEDLHVTVLYGCQDSDAQAVQALLATTPPVKITFGQLFVLQPDDDSEVLAVRVYGDGLRDLHYKLASDLAVELTYPEFIGHMTLAYLKPGTANKYIAEPAKSLLLGETGLTESLVFSPTEGERTQIDLGGISLLPVIDSDADEFSAGIDNPVNHEIAVAGADGRQVAKLLRQAKQKGTDVLNKICESAFARKFTPEGGGPLLFTEGERQKLTDVLQETLATSTLLGQSSVWLRYLRDEDETSPDRNSDESPFAVFDSSVKPLQPTQAIDYFRSLVPMLRVAPSFDADMRRQSFTLAVATEKTLLRSIHDALVNHLISGKANGTPDIQALLDKAGVSPRNPQYAENVFRTNMMDAYTQAKSETMRDPVIQTAYPVFRYDGIDDGRQGDDHAPKFGKYFPSSVSFAEVRGKRPWNCRCVPRPVHKSEWAKLQEQGFTVEHTWE